jgi:hypothetical protein
VALRGAFVSVLIGIAAASLLLALAGESLLELWWLPLRTGAQLGIGVGFGFALVEARGRSLWPIVLCVVLAWLAGTVGWVRRAETWEVALALVQTATLPWLLPGGAVVGALLSLGLGRVRGERPGATLPGSN